MNIDLIRSPAQGANWVSPARVCLTADGALVSCEDSRAVKLLVGEGGSLPVAEAERYGLVAHRDVAASTADGPEATPDQKAQEPPEDKQIVPPENKRTRRARE